MASQSLIHSDLVAVDNHTAIFVSDNVRLEPDGLLCAVVLDELDVGTAFLGLTQIGSKLTLPSCLKHRGVRLSIELGLAEVTLFVNLAFLGLVLAEGLKQLGFLELGEDLTLLFNRVTVGEREVVHSLINSILALIMIPQFFFILEKFVCLDECRSFHFLVFFLMFNFLSNSDSLPFKFFLFVVLDRKCILFLICFAFFSLIDNLR
jgi:hypothetical protein